MSEPYFQTQGCMSLLCGVHALNNLLGRSIFTEQDLNNICYEFSNDCINPHKYIFGGDFDINVLMKALENKGYQTKWHDNRKEFNYDQIASNHNLIGFLLNTGTTRSFLNKMLGTSARHWVCVKRSGNSFFYFDSKGAHPAFIQKKQQLQSFMKELIRHDNHITYVYQ